MDNPVDTDGVQTILLAGHTWPVPLLAAKQNKIIDPLILSLLPLFFRWQSDKSAALAALGASEYNALLEIAFQAIRPCHPEITREQFLDMKVTLPELIAAFSIIAQQTGVFQKATVGEAVAGNARIGMESSPMSAT
jgi:hypothetical protein